MRPRKKIRPAQGGTTNTFDSGGGSGIGSSFIKNYLGIGGSGDTEVNQAVSPDFEPAGYTGPQEFYSPTGEITTQPYADTRGFFGRIFKTNTAERLNKGLENQRLQYQNLAPLELQQARGLQNIETQGAIQRLKEEQKLKEPFLPVVNQALYSGQPGDVDFRFKGDPSTLQSPYVPINPASVEANLQALESKSKRNLERRRMAAIERELTQPKAITAGNAVFSVSPEGQISPQYLVEPGRQLEPTFSIGPDGKPIMTPGGYRPGSIQPQQRKIVGNIYTGQQQQQIGPYKDKYYFPHSEQTLQYPLFEDGQKVGETPGYGGAPVTEPVQPTERLEGLIPDLYRGTGAIIGQGREDIGNLVKPYLDVLDELRKKLIRKGNP